jgi:diamine N-acetyltransferase
MSEIIIQEAKNTNLKELQSISIQTFKETFTEHNSEADMNHYLENSFSDEKLDGELNNPDSKFFFAFFENKIVGYLKLNIRSAQTEIQNQNAMELERIYVLKEYLGKQVGQQLFQQAIHSAKLNHVDFLWLGVWEHNQRAIRFYEKNGFIAFDKHQFKLGQDVQTDIMMKLLLNQ